MTVDIPLLVITRPMEVREIPMVEATLAVITMLQGITIRLAVVVEILAQTMEEIVIVAGTTVTMIALDMISRIARKLVLEDAETTRMIWMISSFNDILFVHCIVYENG